MITVPWSKVEISQVERKKKNPTDIIQHQLLYIRLLKMEIIGTHGDISKCCKGHVNDSSRHANSIFSLSEEHQALAGTKMRLLNLQQHVLLHNSLFTSLWAPEKPPPPPPPPQTTKGGGGRGACT